MFFSYVVKQKRLVRVSSKKNKKGLASVILAPIRLKFELVIYIIMEVVIFVNTNFKKNKNNCIVVKDVRPISRKKY